MDTKFGGKLFMLKKNMLDDTGRTKSNSSTMNFVSPQHSIKIDIFKSLEQLSTELSEKYGKKIQVVDILQKENYKVKSTILNGTYDCFLEGYKFNTQEHSEIIIGQLKILNEETRKYDVTTYSLVFRDRK
jgi:hypothetical protein